MEEFVIHRFGPLAVMRNSISITTGGMTRLRPNDFSFPASHAFGDISCVDDQGAFSTIQE